MLLVYSRSPFAFCRYFPCSIVGLSSPMGETDWSVAISPRFTCVRCCLTLWILAGRLSLILRLTVMARITLLAFFRPFSSRVSYFRSTFYYRVLFYTIAQLSHRFHNFSSRKMPNFWSMSGLMSSAIFTLYHFYSKKFNVSTGFNFVLTYHQSYFDPVQSLLRGLVSLVLCRCQFLEDWMLIIVMGGHRINRAMKFILGFG